MMFNQENDDGFLSLLSVQREILNRLKKETARKAMTQIKDSRTIVTPTPILGNGDSDPFHLMNEPIMEHRSINQGASLQKVQSQRISVFDIPPPYLVPVSSDCFDRPRGVSRQMITPNKLQKSKRYAEQENGFDGIFANTFLFDSGSTAERVPNSTESYYAKKPDTSAFTPKPVPPKTKRLDSNIDSMALKREFKNFIAAMEKSIKSQQDIHDWDRKMGLKRSHSKTMRLSMRSRKKLRKIVVNV